MRRGYQWEGEPRIVLTEDGATMEFKGGQPVMDTGLENAVLISLFTDEGWTGNAFQNDSVARIGSRFEQVAKGSITRTMLNETAQEAERALAWLVKEKIAGSIKATARNRSGFGVDVTIEIHPLTGGVRTIVVSRYGQNWISQITDPAQERLSPQ